MRYVPNALTTLRMMLTPLWLVLLYSALYNPSTLHFLRALLMLFMLGATDYADGAIAKMRNGRYKSNWGAKWDPIADKFLFWLSAIVTWHWMITQAGVAPSELEVVLCVMLSAVTGVLVCAHVQLDIISTKLRSSGESAKQLGRIKFAVDLLTILLALTVAWGTNQNNQAVVLGYILITASLGVAVWLARTNVNNRREAQCLATS